MVPQRGRQLSYRMAGFRVANTTGWIGGGATATPPDKVGGGAAIVSQSWGAVPLRRRTAGKQGDDARQTVRGGRARNALSVLRTKGDGPMTMTWGQSLYGNPCRECGYDWSITPEEALALMATIPARYAALLGESDGAQRHPALGWSAGAYVCHVTDNLRIWAERLAGCALGGGRNVHGYDADLLAQARVYERVPVVGALWSLRHAVDM